MSEWNFDDTMRDYEPQESLSIDITDKDEQYVTVYPESNAMYNDFLNDPYMNVAYFNKDLFIDNDDTYVGVSFNYSGESECMGCGQAADFYDDEGKLMGECCDEAAFCSICGASYRHEDDLIEVDGRLLCDCCFDDEVTQDAITGENHLIRNMTPIRLVSDRDETKIIETVYVMDVEHSCSAKYFTNIRKREILNRFYTDPYYYVYERDCTDEGLAAFGFEKDDESLKDTTWMNTMNENYQKPDEKFVIENRLDWMEFFRARNLMSRGDFFSAECCIGDIAMAL